MAPVARKSQYAPQAQSGEPIVIVRNRYAFATVDGAGWERARFGVMERRALRTTSTIGVR